MDKRARPGPKPGQSLDPKLAPALPTAAQREWHQHDLDPIFAARLCQSVRAGDAVLEAGAGKGALVEALLARGARVAAIEIDRQRAAALRERFAEAIAARHLEVSCGDALLLAPDLPAGWRIVANPPFNLTAPLLRRWVLEDLPGGPPARFDLLLQREAALKACGETRLGVLFQLLGTPRIVAHPSQDCVQPPSHVPLAVFSVQRQPDAPSPAELRAVDQVLEAAFSGPRTVREALRRLATPAMLRRNASDHGYELDQHPRHVPAPAWRDLAGYLRDLGRV